MMTCQVLVELVTDYLDGSLDDDTTHRFDAHIRDCPDCTAYVEQIRITQHLIAASAQPTVSPSVRDRLLRAFRSQATVSPGQRRPPASR